MEGVTAHPDDWLSLLATNHRSGQTIHQRTAPVLVVHAYEGSPIVAGLMESPPANNPEAKNRPQRSPHPEQHEQHAPLRRH